MDIRLEMDTPDGSVAVVVTADITDPTPDQITRLVYAIIGPFTSVLHIQHGADTPPLLDPPGPFVPRGEWAATGEAGDHFDVTKIKDADQVTVVGGGGGAASEPPRNDIGVAQVTQHRVGTGSEFPRAFQ